MDSEQVVAGARQAEHDVSGRAAIGAVELAIFLSRLASKLCTAEDPVSGWVALGKDMASKHFRSISTLPAMYVYHCACGAVP